MSLSLSVSLCAGRQSDGRPAEKKKKKKKKKKKEKKDLQRRSVWAKGLYLYNFGGLSAVGCVS